jgi:hypothetical protein
VPRRPRLLEKADIGALQLIAKALHDGVEASFVEIELRPAADQLEASSSVRLR